MATITLTNGILMSEFTLDNYSKLNEESQKFCSSKFPVYIESTIYNEFVDWTGPHIKNNPVNSLTQKYSESPKKAKSDRLIKILDSFKNKLQIGRSMPEGPTKYEIHLSEFTTSGKQSRPCYSELVSIGDDDPQRVYLISLNPLLEHRISI